MSTKIKPGMWIYAVGIIPFIAGVVVNAFLLKAIFLNMERMEKSFTRIVAPGEDTIILPRPGEYTVYYEYESRVNGETYDTPEDPPSGLVFTLADAKSGEKVPVVHEKSNETYSLFDFSGVAIMKFSVDKPGLYNYSARVPGWETDGEEAIKARNFVLAIGQGFTASLLVSIGGIFIVIAVFISTIGISTGIIVWTWVKRHGAKLSSVHP